MELLEPKDVCIMETIWENFLENGERIPEKLKKTQKNQAATPNQEIGRIKHLWKNLPGYDAGRKLILMKHHEWIKAAKVLSDVCGDCSSHWLLEKLNM